MSPIKTAVFPVAGLGSRFLPITKASPKEMLPIVDRPIIHYAVEEAIAAGITQLVFVTSHTKRAIEDYFDSQYELERRLEEKGKDDLVRQLRAILPEGVRCVYLRQTEPRGLGDAVLTARDVVGEHPFAVMLADDMIAPTAGGELCLPSMVAAFSRDPECSLLGVTPIAKSLSDQYGVVSPAAAANTSQSFAIDGIVEKPKPAVAPSSFGVVGRYILTADIFPYLQRQEAGRGGEIQLTDAIAQLLLKHTVKAFPIAGKRYDCGSKLGYLEALVAYALQREEFRDEFRAILHRTID